MSEKNIGMRAYGDYLLVETPKSIVKEKTDSGIIKSDAMIAKEKEEAMKQLFLKVGSVGFTVENVTSDDEVFISPGNYTQLELKGTPYWLVHKTAILGIKS